jgi:hypothetical protein
MHSAVGTLSCGLPHSEIQRSQPGYRLLLAYRRFPRPSSPLDAKTSTVRSCGSITPTRRREHLAALPTMGSFTNLTTISEQSIIVLHAVTSQRSGTSRIYVRSITLLMQLLRTCTVLRAWQFSRAHCTYISFACFRVPSTPTATGLPRSRSACDRNARNVSGCQRAHAWVAGPHELCRPSDPRSRSAFPPVGREFSSGPISVKAQQRNFPLTDLCTVYSPTSPGALCASQRLFASRTASKVPVRSLYVWEPPFGGPAASEIPLFPRTDCASPPPARRPPALRYLERSIADRHRHRTASAVPRPPFRSSLHGIPVSKRVRVTRRPEDAVRDRLPARLVLQAPAAPPPARPTRP